MGLTSLQVCMDPSDWLQGAMSDDGVIDTSSPSSVDMLTCSRPMMERRLRPPHDQVQKCPRCESTHTKFCYYNNYSLSQPRYFCKTCRRYWTKGGTLRNIPVGGGCRKNKKSSSSSKKSSEHQSQSTSIGQNPQFVGSGPNPTDLQLSFPEVQLSHHLTSLIGAHAVHGGSMDTGFLDDKYSHIGFLGSKFDALVGHGATRGHDLHGSSNIGVDFGIVGGGGFGSDHHLSAHNHHHHGLATPSNLINPHSSSSGFGFSIDGNSSGVLENNYQRLMLPYDFHHANSNNHDHQTGLVDIKPNPKLLSLEWHDNNGGAGGNKDSFGYNAGVNGLTSWGSAMFNGYNPSSTNPLI